MDPFLSEIKIFTGNFAPRGWAFCNGQLLPIVQNTALFSLIGTTYGGDGRTTFALPNLQGRVPIHPRQGPGLSAYNLGDIGGVADETLAPPELAAHDHQMLCSAVSANTASPTGATWAPSVGRSGPFLYATGAPDTTMSPAALGAVGGNQPHTNMSPFLVLNYIIALNGIFPERP